MSRRRDGAAQGDPPAYLLSLPQWNLEGRSPDATRAREEWDRARDEWVRNASTLEASNAIYGPGFDPGPVPDPRIPGHDTRGTTR